MVIDRTCQTCEFNFSGVCAEDMNYGKEVTNSDIECEGWSISLDYFSEIINKSPWYIKQPYENGKLSIEELLQKLEEDKTGRGTKINIYDAIAHVYGIPWWELGGILGVRWSVVGRAVSKGTVDKRKKQFAPILRIPEEYFDEFYSKQIENLEKCREEFYLIHGEDWIMEMRKQSREELNSER